MNPTFFTLTLFTCCEKGGHPSPLFVCLSQMDDSFFTELAGTFTTFSDADALLTKDSTTHYKLELR